MNAVKAYVADHTTASNRAVELGRWGLELGRWGLELGRWGAVWLGDGSRGAGQVRCGAGQVRCGAGQVSSLIAWVMPCHATPRHAIPRRATPCLPCRAVPCHAVPCCAVPCRAVLCRAVPCRAVPCYAVPCRAVPYHSHLMGRGTARHCIRLFPPFCLFLAASPPPLLPRHLTCCLATSLAASPPPLLPHHLTCCLATSLAASPPPLLPRHLPCCLVTSLAASSPPLLPRHLPCFLVTSLAASSPPLLPRHLPCCLVTSLAPSPPFSHSTPPQQDGNSISFGHHGRHCCASPFSCKCSCLHASPHSKSLPQDGNSIGSGHHGRPCSGHIDSPPSGSTDGIAGSAGTGGASFQMIWHTSSPPSHPSFLRPFLTGGHTDSPQSGSTDGGTGSAGAGGASVPPGLLAAPHLPPQPPRAHQRSAALIAVHLFRQGFSLLLIYRLNLPVHTNGLLLSLHVQCGDEQQMVALLGLGLAAHLFRQGFSLLLIYRLNLPVHTNGLLLSLQVSGGEWWRVVMAGTVRSLLPSPFSTSLQPSLAGKPSNVTSQVLRPTSCRPVKSTVPLYTTPHALFLPLPLPVQVTFESTQKSPRLKSHLKSTVPL
ncbi:unnamed protein product [Closterium sp. NIES-54]